MSLSYLGNHHSDVIVVPKEMLGEEKSQLEYGRFISNESKTNSVIWFLIL